MSGITSTGDVNNDGIEDSIECSNNTVNENYQCIIYISGEKKNILQVKNNNECSYFSMSFTKKNELRVECGSRGLYNGYYYKYDDSEKNWLLSRYEYIAESGNSDGIEDDFTVDSNILMSLKRSLFQDISEKGNRMISIGYIKKKTYIYDNKYFKTKMYLVKGDKVLILSTKKDPVTNKKWYKIYFKGKKDIIAWIDANHIEYLSLSTKFLEFNE
ncbi:hypothetical protein MUU45_002314 [Rodentibacter pneumotropicus]|uniref:Uncharacterized protein n=1 Tax=Rodentibacter pneumotropicus TaxID=758 RepID=A0AAW5LDV7_9PAST|nr:hypothetical protein [Rodentibacter pneumotropicus]MCQ9122248.1 hypothetical protein [Rodentibacter pneumotropicus]